jgi:aryl-alcohol dehydrogenase-like predicted oxidoreductase
MSVERIEIEPGFSISRIIKGGWQLSAGHSQAMGADPVEDMFAFADAGVTTFDCADIYTGVEELIGKFLAERKNRLGHHDDIQILTKFVPDYDALPTLNKQYVERIIDRSLRRLGVEQLDMVQFSWWTYDVPGWVEAAVWLKELQQAGKIRLISGTNFNTEATRQIIKAGVTLSTMQVQYSVIDNRPEKGLAELCVENNVKLLCYGTVAGGFLSEPWLGEAEPLPPFENRSQVKYRLMIDEFGSWMLYQELLRMLKRVADKHQTSLANVATRYVLQQPAVGAAIIGARTSVHLNENLGVFDFSLDQSDIDEIRGVIARRRGPYGDVFDLERVKDGPHGSIMRYNLNKISD